nr:hypothetical protein [uncultured Pseudoxanthomonas sp.]
MKLRHVFASAIVRRLAYLLVGAVLAWAGLSDAHAQSGCPANSQPSSGSGCGSQGAAYSACMSAAASYTGAKSQACESATIGATWGYYACTRNGSATGCNSAGRFYYFLKADSCASKPSQITQFLPLTGSSQCWNGCVVTYMQNGDDTTSTRSHTGAICSDTNFKDNCPSGSFWNGHMGVCQPIQPDCPTGQTRVDGQCKPENQCPDGMVAVQGSTPGAVQQGALYCKPADEECPPGNVKAPSGQCLPGEGQCAAGEARRPNGTCGIDSDGDGQADEDDDNPNNDPNKPSASGGDSCNQPPSCSGGPIDCMQVKIQWRIDCNTRKSRNISGGSCGAVPVCTGEKCDALEYNSLVMQWRTACAVEKLKPGTSEPGSGEAIKPDFEAFAGTSDGANPEDSIFLPDGDAEGFSEGLISYGAGALGWNFTVEGQQFAMPVQITDFIAVLRWLIIAAATVAGIAIAWGKL